MGQRLLTLRVRPARVAVLISSKSGPADFVAVVRFLSQLWGGQFNPILAVDPDNPDPLTEFRLNNNRPDLVFGLNLNDAVWKPAVHKASQPREYLPLSKELTEDIKSNKWLGLIHSDRAVISMSEAKAKPSSLVRPLRIVSVEPNSPWLPYYAALFGLPLGRIKEKYRDEEEELKPTNAVDLITDHLHFVNEWKVSWLQAGSYGLTTHHFMSPMVAPTIVLVKDLIPDLCLFWNTRTTGDSDHPAWVLPIPVSEAAHDEVQSALRNWLLRFDKYGARPNYCEVISASVDKETIEPLAASLQKRFIGSTIEYVDYRPVQNHLDDLVAFEYSTTWPGDLHANQLTIVPPAPRNITSRHSESWFVDILKDNKTGRAVRDIQLPSSTIVPDLLRAPSPPGFEHTLVPRFGDGIDSLNFHTSSSKDTVKCEVPTAEEVLEELLREHGFEVLPDEKRGSYLPTIRRFGGISMAADAVSGEAGKVLEILRSGRLRQPAELRAATDVDHQLVLIAQGHTLTVRQIKGLGRLGRGRLGDEHFYDRIDRMLNRESERIKRIGAARFRRYAGRKVPSEMTLEALLEHWAEKSVLQRRWQIGPCGRCSRSSFVDAIHLRKGVRCSHCGGRIAMKPVTEIGYALEPSIRHSLSQGLATVVLTGRFLRNFTSSGFFWLPGLKYQRGGIRGDIDILACCDGIVIFGECKKLTSTPHDAATWNDATEQFLTLAKVAQECGAGVVVLAALVDRYPEDVVKKVEAELTGKVPHLLLNKSDLEEGYRQAEPGGQWRPIRLHDLLIKRFPEIEVKRSGGPRQIEFGGMTNTIGPPPEPDKE